jgi:putative inorganic carbon (HCO3(-)) transporter
MPIVESKWDRLISYLIGTLLFFLPLVFSPLTYISFEPLKLALLRILSVLIAAAIILKYANGEPIYTARSRLALPIVSFSLLLVLSTAFSLNLHTSVWGELYRYEGLVTNLNYFFLFFVGFTFVRSEERIRGLLRIWLLSATLIAVYGLLQHFGVEFFPWDTSSMDVSRSFSTLGNASFLGAYLALTIPLGLALAALTKDAPGKKGRGTWFLPLLASLVLIAALVFTYSRSAIGGFFVAVVVTSMLLIFSDKKNRRLYLIWAASLFVVIVLIAGLSALGTGKSMFGNWRLTSGGSVSTRILLWKGAIDAIKERPLLGSGPDSFKLVFPSFRPETWFAAVREIASPDKAHNESLQTAVGSGLLGLVAYLWLIIGYFVLTVRALLRSSNRRRKIVLAAFFAGTLAYFFQMQMSFSVISVSPLFWLALGITESQYLSEQRSPLKKTGRRKTSLSRAAYLVAFAMVAFGVVLSLRPVAAEVFTRRAFVSRGSGLWRDTALNLERAVALNANEDSYHLRLGEAYLEIWKSGDEEGKERALEAFLRAKSLNPWNEKIHFYLGDYYRLRGKVAGEYWYEKAIESFARLTALDSNNSDAYARLGLVYAEMGQYPRAIGAWEKGLKLNPGQTSLFYNMARAYELAGKFPEAVTYYQKVLRVEPNNTYAYQSLARLKGKTGSRE